MNNIGPVPGAVPFGGQVGQQVYFNAEGQAEQGDGLRLADRFQGLKDAVLPLDFHPLQDHLPVT